MTLGNNDNGTDRQTDRVRRNMRPPPREEGRIITESRNTRLMVAVVFTLYVNKFFEYRYSIVPGKNYLVSCIPVNCGSLATYYAQIRHSRRFTNAHMAQPDAHVLVPTASARLHSENGSELQRTVAEPGKRVNLWSSVMTHSHPTIRRR